MSLSDHHGTLHHFGGSKWDVLEVDVLDGGEQEIEEGKLK
jgi:hypothetical protein